MIRMKIIKTKANMDGKGRLKERERNMNKEMNLKQDPNKAMVDFNIKKKVVWDRFLRMD